MNIAPTIEIQPGHAFSVMVTQDLGFARPYGGTIRP
jgi:type IV secretory pathway VirB10-like protein